MGFKFVTCIFKKNKKNMRIRLAKKIYENILYMVNIKDRRNRQVDKSVTNKSKKSTLKLILFVTLTIIMS